jgi:predicted metal-binding protein
LREKIASLLEGRVHEQGVVPVSSLVFNAELLKYCAANACGHYNKSWTCPPASGALEDHRKRILSYKNAFVFTTKYDLEDSFDYEGMTAGKEMHAALTLEIREKLDGQALVYGAGSCPCCKLQGIPGDCAFPDPCRFPGKTIFSIESAGINVVDLSGSAGIKYNNGPNTVTYFSMLLFG